MTASVPKTDFKSLISVIEANDEKAIEDEATRLARHALATKAKPKNRSRNSRRRKNESTHEMTTQKFVRMLGGNTTEWNHSQFGVFAPRDDGSFAIPAAAVPEALRAGLVIEELSESKKLRLALDFNPRLKAIASSNGDPECLAGLTACCLGGGPGRRRRAGLTDFDCRRSARYRHSVPIDDPRPRLFLTIRARAAFPSAFAPAPLPSAKVPNVPDECRLPVAFRLRALSAAGRTLRAFGCSGLLWSVMRTERTKKQNDCFRRQPDIVGAGLERRGWADTAPTVIAQGRTGVRTRAGISLRARTASTTRACTTPSAPSAPAPPRFLASAQSPSSALLLRGPRASTRLGITSGREPGQTCGPCSRPCDSLTARGGQTGPKGAA